MSSYSASRVTRLGVAETRSGWASASPPPPFGLIGLFMILVVLLWKGFAGLSLAVFTEMTPPPGSAGGLLNAIVGSLIMTVIGVAVGAPLGMLAGTYLAEYGQVFEARLRRSLHQRHPAQRPVDRDRSLRLRDHGGADGSFLGHRRRHRVSGPGGSGRGSDDRRHAEPCSQSPCVKPARRSACRAPW